MFNRGEIYELMTDGSAELKYAVIISAEDRTQDKVQSIIVLTEQCFDDRCIPIPCRGTKYANCSRVCYTRTERIGGFMRCITAEEMAQIDAAIAESLGLNMPLLAQEVPIETPEVSRANEKPVAENTPMAAGFTRDELEGMKEFIETEFLPSIQRDHSVDNLYYVSSVCDAYKRIEEMLEK